MCICTFDARYDETRIDTNTHAIGDGTFDILYDDGEQEKGVKQDLLRPLGPVKGPGAVASESEGLSAEAKT